MLTDQDEKKLVISEAADDAVGVPAAITDTGCERDLNEDRYAVIESPSGVAWVVCDGMGGVNGGELAAQLAIDAIRREFESHPVRSVALASKQAILEANRIICLRRQNPAFSNMGTTIVSALFQGAEVAISHVGDSRAYLVRDSAIQQLTIDHTYVQDLVDSGKISADDALSHPQSHVLTKCIGSEPSLEIDINKFWIWEVGEGEPEDMLLLCSDGLYSLVTEPEISTIMSENPPQRSCVSLVELAKSRGGYDNITLAIIPLGGQLRNKPPIGYVEGQDMRVPAVSGGFNFFNLDKATMMRMLVLVILCGLAALLTAMFLIFTVVRS